MAGILTRYEDESKPPDFSLSSDYRLQWAKQALTEGEQFLRYGPKGQHRQSVDLMERTHERLLRMQKFGLPRGILGLSETYCNELLRIFNILSADLTDFRPFWNFETYNKQYERQARNHTNLATSWWQRTHADRELSLLVKQSLKSATGVGHLFWDRRISDFRMKSVNPLDVLPVRPNDPTTYQDSLAVIIRHERTLNSVRQQFPRFASSIKADRDGSTIGMSSYQRDIVRDTVGNSAGAAADAFDSLPVAKIGPMPIVDLYYLYVDDRSVNESSSPILMGEWDRTPEGKLYSLNHWSYEVEPGAQRYPFKRLIIFTSNCVLYDGPSMYWHGMYPVVKFTPDPHPELWYGISPIWACLPLQDSLDKLYQAMDDHVQLYLRPGVSGDRRIMNRAEMAKVDPRQPNQRYLGDMGKEAKRVDIPTLDPFIERYADRIVDRMEALSGVKNLTQILGLNQMPEGETIERLMQAMTPEVRNRSRNLESFCSETGRMMLSNFTEFYTEARMFAVFGEEGLTPEMYDFDPFSLVPAYTNGDFAEGRLDPNRQDVDLRPRWVREREFNTMFALNIKPGTLLESASMSRKVMVAMVRSNKDIDRYTYLHEMGFDNLGPEPPGTIEERLRKEIMDDAMAVAMATNGGVPPMPNIGIGNPLTRPEGRQFSNQEPPHMEGDKISTS